jgi:hypothetical protein
MPLMRIGALGVFGITSTSSVDADGAGAGMESSPAPEGASLIISSARFPRGLLKLAANNA